MVMPSFFPVTCHTDYVTSGSTFIAIPGTKYNGVAYIPLAIQKGATTVVVEESAHIPQEIQEYMRMHTIHCIKVDNARQALASMSAQAAGNPAEKLHIIGVTGTKGKTTTVYILEHVLRSVGINVARITGVTNSINGIELPSSLTTPQPDYLHQFFALCLRHKVTHVVMEVAAQGLSLHRLDTVSFDGIIFTNIAREHFEFYPDLETYFAAKCTIFNHIKEKTVAFVNGDDTRCAQLKNNYPYIQRYGFTRSNDICAIDISTPHEVSIMYNNTVISCPSLIGHYNASNIVAAVSMAHACGLGEIAIQQAMLTFSGVPGRMERHQLPNGALAIIDYAHNPSSYQALLSTLRPLTDRLIVLFGASGSRDQGKRALMGAIAAQYADIVILTSDNPGPINPEHIIDDIMSGIAPEHMGKVICEVDRARAITRGYEHTGLGSFLVLLGKGCDEYQVIGTTKSHFSERALVQNLS